MWVRIRRLEREGETERQTEGGTPNFSAINGYSAARKTNCFCNYFTLTVFPKYTAVNFKGQVEIYLLAKKKNFPYRHV